MSIRFAPKLITAALVTGAALFLAAPSAQAWGGGYGPPPHAYGRPVPPPHFRGPPPYANPYGHPRRHWAWRHHYRPPPPYVYGRPGYAW